MTSAAMTCSEARISLGVYVIGALEPAERAAVESHLAECPACREELVRLAGLPGLLGRLSVDDVLTDGVAERAPDHVLERALAEIARRRRRGRQRLLAAAAVIAVGGTAAGIALSTAGAAPGRTLSATDARTHVHAVVHLTRAASGTDVSLRLAGVPARDRCALVAVAKDGHQEVAASWVATYDGEATVRGETAIPASELKALRIVEAGGRTLLSLPA